MPIANGFLSPEQFAEEYFFELKVAFCENCRMVQLAELVERERMFHENYAFFSSTSTRMARALCGVCRVDNALVLEQMKIRSWWRWAATMASCCSICQGEVRHLGIEPSANVAEVAKRKGMRTLSRFLTKSWRADFSGGWTSRCRSGRQCDVPHSLHPFGLCGREEVVEAARRARV